MYIIYNSDINLYKIINFFKLIISGFIIIILFNLTCYLYFIR